MHFQFARFRSQSPLFWLGAGVLALSFALPLPRASSIANLPSVCPFFNFSGWPCPGCGLTRSFVCLAHGHLSEALRWHPLGPLLFVLALLFLLGSIRKWKAPNEKLVVLCLALLLLVSWAVRLSGVWPLPSS